MTRYNILWGLLHGGCDKPADWVRGSSEKPGWKGRDEDVRAILPEMDDSVRGWMTETLVRMALSSSYAEAILKEDPVNTYSELLDPSGPKLFTTRSNIEGAPVPSAMFVTEPASSGKYERVVRFMPIANIPGSSLNALLDDTYSFRYTPTDGASRVMPVTFEDGTATLPFDDGQVTVMGVTRGVVVNSSGVPKYPLDITFKSLPRTSPFGVLERRLLSKDPNAEAGFLCLDLLRRHA